MLAVVSVLADEAHVPVLDGLRQATSHVISGKSASTALQAIATGLLTVTSITFSVLLLAAQQTASNLSPVVFDQFVRRRINQVLLGFFVGLCVFAYLVMGAQTDTPPVVGAATATLLTVVAMVLLLVLIYVTIDQMRPANVLRQIHRQTLDARQLQTRPAPAHPARAPRHRQGDGPVPRRPTGYVTGIDLATFRAALERAPRAEIRLNLTLGQAVTYGDVIATVHDDDEGTARSLADEVRGGILLDQWRDIARDATTGVAEITNIAWTSGSTAKQSPQVARQGLDILKDLLARSFDEDDGEGGEPSDDGEEPLNVVYPDTYRTELVDALYAQLVVGPRVAPASDRRARARRLPRAAARRTARRPAPDPRRPRAVANHCSTSCLTRPCSTGPAEAAVHHRRAGLTPVRSRPRGAHRIPRTRRAVPDCRIGIALPIRQTRNEPPVTQRRPRPQIRRRAARPPRRRRRPPAPS